MRFTFRDRQTSPAAPDVEVEAEFAHFDQDWVVFMDRDRRLIEAWPSRQIGKITGHLDDNASSHPNDPYLVSQRNCAIHPDGCP